MIKKEALEDSLKKLLSKKWYIFFFFLKRGIFKKQFYSKKLEKLKIKQDRPTLPLNKK